MHCAQLALAPQWKVKSQLYLCVLSSHRYDDTLKIEICANIDHHWSKKPHFFVCKRTAFFNQLLGKFVKMILTRVLSHCLTFESSHSVKNVTRVESPSFLNVTWAESLTGVTLSLQFAGTDHTKSSPASLNTHCYYFKYVAYCHLYLKKHVWIHRELEKG